MYALKKVTCSPPLSKFYYCKKKLTNCEMKVK